MPVSYTHLSIGPLSRFDDGKPDYVKRLKKSFKEGCPLIDSLKPFCGEPIVPEEHGLSDAKDVFSVSYAHPRYCAQTVSYTHLDVYKRQVKKGIRRGYYHERRKTEGTAELSFHDGKDRAAHPGSGKDACLLYTSRCV